MVMSYADLLQMWYLYNIITNVVYKTLIEDICIFQLVELLCSYYCAFIECKLIDNNSKIYV